jgi:hypothetical protein
MGVSKFKLRPIELLYLVEEGEIGEFGGSIPNYTGTSVHERPCSRTIRFTNKFSEQKTPRMTNGVSDYEHASWQKRPKSIGAGVSVAG